MERLRRVASTLAAHGQHELAREVADVSFRLKQAAPTRQTPEERARQHAADNLLAHLVDLQRDMASLGTLCAKVSRDVDRTVELADKVIG